MKQNKCSESQEISPQQQNRNEIQNKLSQLKKQ